MERPSAVEWLPLLDGSPLVSRAGKLTGRTWPRLAGSDLIGPVLDAAEAKGTRVGFLGGSEEAHRLVHSSLSSTHPNLQVAGWWAPDRAELTDQSASAVLAADIAAAQTDILFVCLGKPRQELWISEFGQFTGAKVLLAFGAAVDFLARRVPRAPELAQNLGMEWAWRLALEPRRLANRYLVQGPEAYLKLRTQSCGAAEALPKPDRSTSTENELLRSEGFSAKGEKTDVAALVVTYNNERDVAALLNSLKAETRDQTIKVIVADNSPGPGTLNELEKFPEVYAFPTGGNLGYSAAINVAMKKAGSADSFLILNPDMRLERGAIRAMRRRMAICGAGVVVPLLMDDDRTVYHSLRREPSVCRAFGDAVLGSRLPGRPEWLAETEFDRESYLHPHRVDWATGAALMIRPDAAQMAGDWDEEYFLYSEETDFMHRVRSAGMEVWFEPQARMFHSRAGSGTSTALAALMAANRIRYVRKFHTRSYARAFRAAVVLSALLRSPLHGQQLILAAVTRERKWVDLPHAENYGNRPLRRGASQWEQ
ncbi:WecB/TagA/CpsF family glycosyltransferase [Arthrobacter sp. ISL-85]|uniref:WecB/TagA/CpsF family glycosyltransferase n=1 Tax=Arthrobacter sp. ISL-85 TaxID=2819115 RepID=UPI001BE5A13B|nr:WecB/TagA/CpsF family glycosyltransferase [Arthrobacter sp. ISL-85]MBT2567577.1 WecB/TagA/CpsF family glycosyltransferase [Arthrobacter sp. ISL-85]